jgi:hypothetical protein
MAMASFLLECTSTLPNAEAISAQLVGHDDDDDENGDGENEEKTEKEEEEEKSPGRSLGNSLTETCTVSMTAPRGKFQMTLFDGGMQCVNGKGDTLVITSAHKIVVFPSPQDCRLKKKGGADMVLLCLDNDNDKVAFQEKSLTQVCFALPAEDDSSKMTWIEVLCKSLVFQEKEVIMAQDRKGYTFESFKEGNTSTTTGGMPFVQCYYRVKDGVLFPMKQGLLFFKYVAFWGCLCTSCVSHIYHRDSLLVSIVYYMQTTNVFASVCLAFHCVWTWIRWIAIRGHGTHFRR